MSVTSDPPVQHLVLHDIPWDAYEGILTALGDRSLRHTYDRGDLEMMSPLQEHDWVKRIIGRLIESTALELNIPIKSVGSTTCRREDVGRGVEPDESYYIANEPVVRGRDRRDPAKDPPPDLAVEIDVTRSSLDRMGVYAILGVPEIWRFDGTAITFYRRNDAGQYDQTERSCAFPFLRSADVTRFLDRRSCEDETTLVRAFATWVRDQSGTGPDT